MKIYDSLGALPKRKNGMQKQMSDIELLKFYMELTNKGIIKVGSSGFDRLCEIKNRVKKHEKAIKRGIDEHGRNIKVLQKSINHRAYVKSLIEEVDSTENLLTTQ